MRLTRRIIRSCAVVAIFLALLLPVRQPAFSFFQDDDIAADIRTRVDLVVVPVSVIGEDGNLVAGLERDDFIVYEDGVAQTLANFSVDPVPISAVVVIDTGLSPTSYAQVLQSFPSLTGAFAALDEIAVYRYQSHVAKMSDFTTDKLAVENVLRTLNDITPTPPATVPSGPFSPQGPVINGVPVLPGPRQTIAPPPSQTRRLHDAIFEASQELASRPPERRKMILIISDGQDQRSDFSFDEVLDGLLGQGIQVYAVGMDAAWLSRRFSTLASYASSTGGGECFLSSLQALERCYARSAEQARHQYILGYVSNNPRHPILPVLREIRVETVAKGLEVRHRGGYYQLPGSR